MVPGTCTLLCWCALIRVSSLVYCSMCIKVRSVCFLSATDVSEMEKAELHSYRLMEKYATIWKKKTEKCEHAWRNHFSLFICCEYSHFLPSASPSVSVPFHTEASVVAAFHAVQRILPVCPAGHGHHARQPRARRGSSEADT